MLPIPGNSASAGKKPTPPTIGTASAGVLSASVPFTASTYIGKDTISYTATSNPESKTGTGSSPITVTGLTSGTSYTFTVSGTTNYGVTSDASGFSNPIVPLAPPPTFTVPPTFTTAPPTFTTAPPTFTPAPPTFTPAPPTFTPAPPTFTPAPPTFTPAPPTFTPAPPTFTTAPPTFTTEPPDFTTVTPPSFSILP
jgi:hypothetical protein